MTKIWGVVQEVGDTYILGTERIDKQRKILHTTK